MLYSLGPAVGMVLIVGCLAAWSLCRNWTVSAKAEGCCDEESEHAAPVDSPAPPIPSGCEAAGWECALTRPRVRSNGKVLEMKGTMRWKR